MRSASKCLTAIGCLVVLCLSSTALRASDNVPSLEKHLLSAASRILEFARQKQYRTLGVLKFRVKHGDRTATDRIGTINATLADRLELALILRNRVQEPIGIVHDASSVAAGLEGASHLSAEGRARFFTAQYPLAWGAAQATPDLFLTGAVILPDDLKTMTVSIQGFDRTGALVQVTSFEALPSVAEVLETGGSFSRGLGPNRPALSNVEGGGFSPVQAAVLVQQGKVAHPLSDPQSPVAVDVLYDGRPQAIAIRDGRAVVAEPKEGQQVTLVVRRREPADQRRLGLVVKVNGENTLYRERLPETQSAMWILEPDRAQVTIRGFQMEGGTIHPFRVLSKSASAAKAMDYGRDVGTISFTVFSERDASQATPVADLLDEDGEDFAVIAANKFPTKPPESLGALKQALVTTASRSLSRGILDAGSAQKSETRVVSFERDPIPLLSSSITYFRP